MFGYEVMLIGRDHNFSEIVIPMRNIKSGDKNGPLII